jgi:hypothetical protein
MSPLVKTKRQAILKILSDLEPLRTSSNKKNVVFNSFVCKLGFFGTRGPLNRSFHSRFKLAHSCQKTSIFTRTRQVNYYYLRSSDKSYFIDVKALLQIVILSTDKLKESSYWFPAMDTIGRIFYPSDLDQSKLEITVTAAS